MFKNLKAYIQPTLQDTQTHLLSAADSYMYEAGSSKFFIFLLEKKVSIIRTVGDSSALNQLTVEALIPT